MPLSTGLGHFSVSFELIVTHKTLPYDLYVNSSAVPQRERFVKIFPRGEILDQDTLKEFKEKFHQLYVSENQRSLFLRGIAGTEHLSEIKKTEIIKDSAITYLHRLFDQQKEFTTEILVETIRGCRDSVESMVDVIENYSIEDLYKMVAQLSYHDFYTYDHSINVSMYCIIIFRHLRPTAPKSEVVLAGLGGLLHDLGKLKIPTTIINKPSELSPEEFEVIKKHPGWGEELLKQGMHEGDYQGLDVNTLSRTILEHHENFNGTGYPSQLQGEGIHLMARITAIADFFDAVTTHRSYHEALTIEKALNVMSKSMGRKLDPDLFNLFLDIAGRMIPPSPNPMELPDDFDPCQPQKTLPFRVCQKSVDHLLKGESPRQNLEKNENFGKVITRKPIRLKKVRKNPAEKK